MRTSIAEEDNGKAGDTGVQTFEAIDSDFLVLRTNVTTLPHADEMEYLSNMIYLQTIFYVNSAVLS